MNTEMKFLEFLYVPTIMLFEFGNAVTEHWQSHLPSTDVPSSTMSEFPARSRLDCVTLARCHEEDGYPWRCLSIQYSAGVCRVFAESVALDTQGGGAGQFWNGNVSKCEQLFC